MYSITSDWINSDFMKSKSWSERLRDNAELVFRFSNLSVFRVCDLDLFRMKLVSYRVKDYKDSIGLLKDCPYINQSVINTRLVYLYNIHPSSYDAISFVRVNVPRG